MIARFETPGRSPRTLAIVGAIWVVLAILVLRIDLAPWIAGLGVLATLPALADWITDRETSLTIHPDRIAWVSGRRTGTMAARDIAHVRVDRRFDMRFRLTLIGHDGRGTRLPPELPVDANALEAALDKAGIAYQRHPFSIIPG